MIDRNFARASWKCPTQIVKSKVIQKSIISSTEEELDLGQYCTLWELSSPNDQRNQYDVLLTKLFDTVAQREARIKILESKITKMEAEKKIATMAHQKGVRELNEELKSSYERKFAS